MEKADGSEYRKIDDIVTDVQTSVTHEKVHDVIDDNNCFVEQISPDQTSDMSITLGDTNRERTRKHTRAIETQTDSIKMRDKIIQIVNKCQCQIIFLFVEIIVLAQPLKTKAVRIFWMTAVPTWRLRLRWSYDVCIEGSVRRTISVHKKWPSKPYM